MEEILYQKGNKNGQKEGLWIIENSFKFITDENHNQESQIIKEFYKNNKLIKTQQKR